jgi:hypothetical protein
MWELFQLSIFALFMWALADMPGEKNMSAGALAAYMLAYVLTVFLSYLFDLWLNFLAKLRARQKLKQEAAIVDRTKRVG